LKGPGARAAARGARRGWSRTDRGALAVAGAAACLLLGGCIYLRLLELKHQLADFDRYFAVDLRDGLKITCRQPVLLDEDMAFFKLAPETRERVGVAERWHFRWVKANPPPGGDSRRYEMSVDFIYVDHKLTTVLLPERFFTFMPKPFFLAMVKAFGQASVDQAKRTATASVHLNLGSGQSPPRLTRADLTAMLGAPLETRESAAGLLWRYRYQAATRVQHSGSIDVTFTLEPATHEVRHIHGVVFNGRIDLDFPAAAAQPAPASPAAHDAKS
jgi:hypothetical protein